MLIFCLMGLVEQALSKIKHVIIDSRSRSISTAYIAILHV